MLYKKLPRNKHVREDGWLAEAVSMNYDDEPFKCIHTYIVSINPRCVRANHYHRNKEEWLGITSGKVILSLKNVNTGHMDEVVLDASSDEYGLVYIPPFVAHSVKNICDTEASLIVFSKDSENKEDTIPYEVI